MKVTWIGCKSTSPHYIPDWRIREYVLHPPLYYRCSLWLCALYLKNQLCNFFFKLHTVIGHQKRKNFYNFGLSVAILDFQWLFFLKLLVKWWKMWLNVIFCQMGTVNYFVNKNGRVAIFIPTMADGGHLIFLSTVLIWNGEQCNKKLFSFIQNGLQRPFLWKTFGPMTTKYDLVEAKRMILSMFEQTRI